MNGMLSVVSFTFKLVYEKIIETFELKQIYDSMDLHDFKQLINVL